jgi:hypothetical protein
VSIYPFEHTPVRTPVYNTASNINARYMLDQRYIVQATLLPGTFHTRQAV